MDDVDGKVFDAGVLVLLGGCNAFRRGLKEVILYSLFSEMGRQFAALNSGRSTEESLGNYLGVNACVVATTFRGAEKFPEINFTDYFLVRIANSNIFEVRSF